MARRGMWWNSRRTERAEAEERARGRAERAAYYAGYENPTLADFIGSENICGQCHAVTPNMAKHLE